MGPAGEPAQPFVVDHALQYPTLYHRRVDRMGLQLRKGTTTTAPNHPHNTHSLHGVKGLEAHCAIEPGKHRVTQAMDRRVCGGWGWRSVLAPRASWAWRKHPTDTSAGTTAGGGWDRSPDGPGSPAGGTIADRSDRGALVRNIHAKMDVGEEVAAKNRYEGNENRYGQTVAKGTNEGG